MTTTREKMRAGYEAYQAQIAALSPEERAEHYRRMAEQQKAIAEVFRIDDEAGLV
jgi:hypothetical protein